MNMKTKNRNYIFLAVLMMGIATMMTGCAKEDIASNDNGGGTNPTDMKVDELKVKVTADVPTAVLSSFDAKSMGGALVRRLPKTTSSLDADTKMVLIKGEDILNRPITEWFEVAKIYLRGGYIAVEKPHNAHLVSVMEQLSAKLAQATHAILTEDDGSGIIINYNPSNSQSANAVNAEAERFKARIANIQAKSGHRAASDEQQPVAEMVIFSRNGYYHHESYQGNTFTTETRQEDGTVTKNTVVHNPDYNNYVSGLMADGAAQWLNRHSEDQQVRRAGNRAEGNDYINEVMSADDEYTYDGALYASNIKSEGYGGIDKVTKPNAYHEIIRIWATHNMESNKDYYLVQHSSTASVGGKKDGDDRLDPNKTLYRGPYKENEWDKNESKIDGGSGTVKQWYYGAWYDTANFSFDLKGEGTAQVEGAVPSTDRSEISKTVTVGKFNGQMTTIGGTITGAAKGGGVTGNVNRGWVNGTFYSLATTTTVQELTCKKNTEGTKVSWEYREGRNMAEGDADEHPLIDESLINDVDVSNQVCWSVSNPSGQDTLEIMHQVKMADIYYHCIFNQYVLSDDNGKEYKDIVLSNAIPDDKENVKYALPIPNRAQQTWYMDVDFPELGQDGYTGVKDELTDALKTQFPELYQPTIVLADQTPQSENTIQNLVDKSKKMLNDPNALQTLKGYALDRGVSQFTIKWYCTDGNHAEPYTMTVTAK